MILIVIGALKKKFLYPKEVSYSYSEEETLKIEKRLHLKKKY